MPKPPSLQQIADAAGVAKSTVSYALRNSPKVPDETRERIVNTAIRMGYKPNPLVGALMSHLRATRSYPYQATLAWVTSYPTEDGWKTNQMSRLFYQGAQARCAERGYQLEPVWLRQRGMTARRWKKILEARSIRGILVCSLPVSMGHLSIDLNEFAAVTAGYTMMRPNIDRVACDIYRAVLALFRKVRALGYRRVGAVFSNTMDRRVDYQLTAAIGTYMSRFPGRVLTLRHELGTDDPSIVSRWLDKHEPDFVMGENALAAELIRRTGRKIPEDVGFALFARYPNEVEFAGIDHNYLLAGTIGADFVISKLQLNESGIPERPQIVLIPGDWVDGPTVRQVKHAR